MKKPIKKPAVSQKRAKRPPSRTRAKRALKSPQQTTVNRFRRVKRPYNPDWAVLENRQTTLPILTPLEWDSLFSSMSFPDEAKEKVREEISVALWGFMRMSSGFLNEREYLQSIKILTKEVFSVVVKAYALQRFNYQRWLMLKPVLEADPDYRHSIMPEPPFEHFKIAAEELIGVLNEAMSTISRPKTGRDNEDIFWLVGAVNRVVEKHSKGGALTQSKKRSGGGNDQKFISALFSVAARLGGRPVEDSLAVKAIRRLKKPE